MRNLATKLIELELAVANTHAQIESPARNERQRCSILRHTNRISQRKQHQVGTQAHALSARCNRRMNHKG